MKKIVFLPYDMDTALGINNEGALAFSYNLEDTDTTSGGAEVFNGQKSVLWKNLRETYFDELREMYQKLRSTGALSYEKVEQMFEDHQDKWPEAIFNEDAFFKYLQPLFENGEGSYLSMLQGSKEEQRKWWLYNRFRYIDSKYNAGDALNDLIQLRGYAKANITVIPYADVYPSVKYGSYLVQKRGARNKPTTLECPLDSVNDTEIYIYSASQLASVGDISGLMVGFADFSKATKLQEIKIGDQSSSYSNGNLTELTLGNNKLLKKIDARNCVNLGTGTQQTVDISGCTNIEEVYFGGTSVTGVSLPNGGVLKTLQLPATVTNLTILNQPQISTFQIPSYDNISTLRLENVGSAVDSMAILSAIQPNSRVRITGLTITGKTPDEVITFYDSLDSMRGLDENGNNTEKAQIAGKITVDSITGAQLLDMTSRYPGMKVEYKHITSNVYFYTWDGSQLLYTVTVNDGGNATSPGSPSRSSDAQYTYSFAGWSTKQNASAAEPDALYQIKEDRNLYAAYTKNIRYYTVTFVNNSSGSNVTLQTVQNIPYGGTAKYTGSDPTHASGSSDYQFIGFNPSGENITGNTTCYAVFADMAKPYFKYLKSTITEYESDTVTKIGKYAFYRQTELTKATASATYVSEYAFGDCKKLTVVDLTSTSRTSIAANAFNNCSKLDSLVVRSTVVSTLSATSAFSGTSIVRGEGGIFVPENLVNSYKVATNWSTYADRIYPISAYPKTSWDTISDSWDQILAAETDGTYKTKYTVGDTKIVNMGSKKVYMQIAAFDADDAADGTAKAKITWISKTLYDTHIMNNDLAENYVFAQDASIGANVWKSTNKGVGSSTCSAKWDITVGEEAILTVRYKVGSEQNYDKLTVKVNDNIVANAISGNIDWRTSEVSCSAGDVVHVEASYSKDSSGDNNGDTAYVDFVCDKQITISQTEIGGAVVGTGSIGGWENASMRSYLQGTVLPSIQDNVRNAIKPVKKRQYAYSVEKTKFEQTTNDTIWIPSYREVGFTDTQYKETAGPIYSDLFKSNDSRIKYNSTGAPSYWWLRSAYTSYSFSCVYSNGISRYYTASSSYGVVFGFCT